MKKGNSAIVLLPKTKEAFENIITVRNLLIEAIGKAWLGRNDDETLENVSYGAIQLDVVFNTESEMKTLSDTFEEISDEFDVNVLYMRGLPTEASNIVPKTPLVTAYI